jgi:hypothetical protein
VRAGEIKGDGLVRAGRRASQLAHQPAIAAGHQSGPSDEFSGGIKVGKKQIGGDGPVSILATGSQALVDNAGVKYFVNTDITFSTSSSASAAMSEASFDHAVAATTLNGGTVASTLNDAFDGYNTLCISVNGTVATCETGNPNFEIYNKNGPATTEGLGAISGVNRQIVFPPQIVALSGGNVTMSRKVFVPDNDQFARWLNIFTNNGASPQQVTMVIANNLGSDSNTQIVTSSNGNATAELTDSFVTTFQNYSGTTSSDPRIGHVLQGPGARAPLAGIHFADGDDNPFWGYTFTLQPGETGIIMNFVAVQPSKATAAAKATELVSLPANALQFMSQTEQNEVLNFSLNLASGARSVAYWSSAEGLALIRANCTCPGSANSVYRYLRTFRPFQDLSLSNCLGVAAYVQRVENAGKSPLSSLTAKLKAQMLATALNVCYSGAAPNSPNPLGVPLPIGGYKINLAYVCPPGASFCENTSRAFNNQQVMSVSDMLGWASSQYSSGGLRWYGNVQSILAMAHDAFAAINGQRAHGW